MTRLESTFLENNFPSQLDHSKYSFFHRRLLASFANECFILNHFLGSKPCNLPHRIPVPDLAPTKVKYRLAGGRRRINEHSRNSEGNQGSYRGNKPSRVFMDMQNNTTEDVRFVH